MITGRCSGNKHQEELLKANEYPDFKLHARFAVSLNIVWCTMLFSTAMPLLNLIALVYFTFAYFADKYAVLRASKQPPKFDTAPAESAFWWCLYGAVVKLAHSMWIWGNPDVFPSDSLAAEMTGTEDLLDTLSGSIAIMEGGDDETPYGME